MDVRGEIKSLIAKRTTTFKAVYEQIAKEKNIKNVKNVTSNFSNKFKRKTIKFEEVQDILKVLNYHIEFVED